MKSPSPFMPAIILLSFLIGWNSLGQAQELATSDLELDVAILKLQEETEEKRGGLKEKYDKALDALQEKAMKVGDLELVLEVRNEREALKSRSEKPPALSGKAELARLQGIFSDQVTALEKEESLELVPFLEAYRERLAASIPKLTREGKLDEAVAAKQGLVQVDARIAASKNGERIDRFAKRGKFVRIELDSGQPISLAELEVYSGEQNIAFEKAATQSATWGSRTAAGNAVDGNKNGSLDGNSLSHTVFKRDQWWEVDLGSEQEISSIQLWARTDENSRFANRMDGFKLVVLNPDRDEVWSRKFSKAPRKMLKIEFDSFDPTIALDQEEE